MKKSLAIGLGFWCFIFYDFSVLAQITEVNRLEDVQPDDWAYEALRSLFERYGGIAGYPDNTFRGNRTLSRYEFAAALNAAIARINQSIQGNSISREDLATLQRLEKDFAKELEILSSRVESLEARRR